MADADTKAKKAKKSKGDDDEEASKGGLKGKLIPVVVVVVAVVAAQQLGFIGGGSPEVEPTATETEEVVVLPGASVEVAQMTVNLASEDLRYARIGFGLELAAGTDAALLEPKYNLLKDALITIAIGMSPELLRTAAGQQDLRDQLTAKAQEIFPDGEVLRVILTDLVVQ